MSGHADDSRIECAAHGSSQGAFVCQHLTVGSGLGFNQGFDPDDPDALCPDAWCDACEQCLQAEGEWNDRAMAFAGIKMLCSHCYEKLREDNWIQDDEGYEDLAASGFEYLQARQSELMDEFRIDQHERWDWDQTSGKIVFSHQGVPQVDADIHFVGSVSTVSGTWMWAWANESLEESVKALSRSVRELGEELGYLRLAAAHWPATEEDGWEMTAIAAKALDASGAYRTGDDNGYTYMILKNVRWIRPQPGHSSRH